MFVTWLFGEGDCRESAVSVYTTPLSDPADNKCATGRISGEGEADQQEGQGWSIIMLFTFWNFADHCGFNFQEDLKSQNHILDTFMHSIKKVMTDFNVLAEA